VSVGTLVTKITGFGALFVTLAKCWASIRDRLRQIESRLDRLEDQ
jgi:hypothetical protein